MQSLKSGKKNIGLKKKTYSIKISKNSKKAVVLTLSIVMFPRDYVLKKYYCFVQIHRYIE